MAKLTLVFDKKEKIPAGLTDYYVEQEDGSYKLDLDVEIENVDGLKSALKKERDAVKLLKKQIKELGDITPEEVESLREKAEAVDDSDAVKDLNKQLKKAQGELEKANGRVTKLTKKLTDVMKVSEAKTAISDAEGEEEVLLPHVLARAEITEEDDDFVLVAKDAAGEPLMKGGKAGTLGDVVAELKAKPQFAGAFKGTGASGSGARQTTRTGGASEDTAPAVNQSAIDAKRKTGNYSL